MTTMGISTTSLETAS